MSIYGRYSAQSGGNQPVFTKYMFVYIPLPIFSMDLARSLILVSIESGADVCIMSDPYMYVCVVLDSTRADYMNTHNSKQALPWAKGSYL